MEGEFYMQSSTFSPTRIPVDANRSINAKSRGFEQWSLINSRDSSVYVSFTVLPTFTLWILRTGLYYIVFLL